MALVTALALAAVGGDTRTPKQPTTDTSTVAGFRYGIVQCERPDHWSTTNEPATMEQLTEELELMASDPGRSCHPNRMPTHRP